MDQTAPKAGLWNKLRSLTIVRIVLGILIVGVVLLVLQFAFRAAAGASPGERSAST